MGDTARALLPYDRLALAEIDAFKNPPPTALARIIDAIGAPFADLGDVLMDTQVGGAVGKAVEGVVGLLNDGASWTVRSASILDAYRGADHDVGALGDIGRLRLEDADRVVGYLGAKYKAIALAEGAATGAGGLAGLFADIPLIVGLALRAVNEYATYYGFDTSVQHERMYVLEVLAAASSPTAVSKHAALAELTRIGALAAKKAAWADLEKIASVQIIKKVADAIGIRLTKAKLAQVVPMIGAAVGGGVNAWYMASVTETAYLLYRERFLMGLYGPEIAVQVRELAEDESDE